MQGEHLQSGEEVAALELQGEHLQTGQEVAVLSGLADKSSKGVEAKGWAVSVLPRGEQGTRYFQANVDYSMEGPRKLPVSYTHLTLPTTPYV